jgi:hypothetical protein
MGEIIGRGNLNGCMCITSSFCAKPIGCHPQD